MMKMNRRRLAGWMNCFLIILLFGVGTAGARQQANGLQLNGTEIMLDPVREEWTLGEPVYVYLHILNRATVNGLPAPLNCRSNLSLSGDLELQYSSDTVLPQRYRAFRPKAAVSALPAINFTVPAGQYWSYPLVICRDPDHESGFAFEESGEYLLEGFMTLTIDNVPYKFKLHSCQLRISAPEGKDAELYRRMRRPEFADALQQSQINEQVVETFEEIAAQHPDSVYYPVAQFCLSRMNSQQAKYAEGLERLEKILSCERIPLPLEHIYYEQAKCNEGLGEISALYQTLHKLWRDNPGSFFISSLNPLFSKYLIGQTPEVVLAPWNLMK